MHAIPTRYSGVQFRSRLEAKWAAMFDLMGIAWDYEPIDLAGYIPDFIIQWRGNDVLVEVKPALSPMGLRAAIHKIWDSGWREAGNSVQWKAPHA